MDELKQYELTKLIGFKVSDKKHDEIFMFCADRDWNVSKFIRHAIEESMTKVIKEENDLQSK